MKTSFILDGYFSANQLQNIKDKLEGKSYMNFQIEGGGMAGNLQIVTSTNSDYTQEELR